MADRLAGLSLLLCFLGAAWFSAVATRADIAYQKNTLPSLKSAVELAPDNAVFRALLAEQIEGAGGDPKPQLIESTKISPLDSQNWIRLAFQEEVEGDYGRAESHLLQAALVDHKAPPRWALMNFYFRQERDAEFWSWVTKALEMSQGDVTSIFRLAWDRTDNGSFVLSKIPNRKDLMGQYLGFLSSTGRIDAAHEVALRVAHAASSNETPLLLSYCDHYATIDPSRAVAVWNILCERDLIPYAPLRPEDGKIITNSDLKTEPVPRAFDWKMKSIDDATVSQGEDGLRVELGGNQPEECILLQQTVPLTPGKTYVISWESGASGSDPVTGLNWDVVQNGDVASGAVSGIAGANPGLVAFRAVGPSASLRLRYRRPLGSVRAKGTVVLRSLRAAVQP